jgi:hypothetical protein
MTTAPIPIYLPEPECSLTDIGFLAVAIGFIPDASSAGVCQLLPSLLAFDPSTLGLPPFDDLIHGVTPMDTPIRIRGTVVKGFGRGSKVTAGADSKEGQLDRRDVY